MKKIIKKITITGRINEKLLQLLDKNPNGLQWSELLEKVAKWDSDLHPKTVNGCVWKLVEKYPDLVYKPSKGRFCLIKYRK